MIKAHLHSYREKSISALENGLCLCAKAFKFQANLVGMSFIKRKRIVVTIETKLETMGQPAIGVWSSFLVVHYNNGIVIRLSKEIDYPNHLWSQLVQIISLLLYVCSEYR